MTRFNAFELADLLRSPESDPRVVQFFGNALEGMHRDEHYGCLEFASEGFDVVFKEAPWVIPEAEIVDRKTLYFAAFHLHRAGHEGYSAYTGPVPGGVVFDDTEAEVVRKLGAPAVSGGGGMSAVLKRPVPRWIRYESTDRHMHFQFDGRGCLELVTISAPSVEVR
jgi:hypothetical protein